MSAQTVRWLCMAGVIGGVLQFLAIGSEFLLSVQTGDLFQQVSFIFILLGITGLFAFLESSLGKLGKLAFFLTFSGSVMVAGIKWMNAYVQPVIEQYAPEFFQAAPVNPSPLGEALTISFALMSIGWMLWTLLMLKTSIVSRWGPAFLLAAMLLSWLPGPAFILAIPLFATGVIWLSVSVWKSVPSDEKPVLLQSSI